MEFQVIRATLTQKPRPTTPTFLGLKRMYTFYSCRIKIYLSAFNRCEKNPFLNRYTDGTTLNSLVVKHKLSYY